MATLIDGKKIAKEVREEIKERTSALKKEQDRKSVV